VKGITKAVVVDPSPILREGLVKILSEAGMSCAGFGSIADIEILAATNCKRAVLLVNLGQDCDGVSHGIRYLKERFPESSVVVLSERYSHEHMLCSLRAGACGYLIKDTSCEALVTSLKLVSLGGGEHVFPAQVLEFLCRARPLETAARPAITQSQRVLSSREVEVLSSLSQGKSNKIIAREWGISEETVKVHVKAILRKIRAKNRTEAALWARDHGIDTGDGSAFLTPFNLPRSSEEITGRGSAPLNGGRSIGATTQRKMLGSNGFSRNGDFPDAGEL
jgi:two-component system, NarL family, nitrate/nitrite response regulator NarL